MHYVFSGDHGDSMAQSMMYPPTTAGFSSTSSDGGNLPLNMHADDDIMDDDEDESEADALILDKMEQLASRNRDTLSHEQGKLESSHDTTVSEEEQNGESDDHGMYNTGRKNEPNSEENGIVEEQVGQGDESQEHVLKDTVNVLKDSEGLRGKITNQSVVEDEILDNNVDASDVKHTLERGPTIGQS